MSKHREALFNEIKGSLFEYLVAQELSTRYDSELAFLRALPAHYQAVLNQQDRMTRELYPELVEMLPLWSKQAADGFQKIFPSLKVTGLELTGQLGHTPDERRETDFVLQTSSGALPVSLKLNKRASSVNTKSGGIKSFLTEYFPGEVASREQATLSLLVDTAFAGLHSELHEVAGIAASEGWDDWRRQGLSELPGELPPELSQRLHKFYAVLSKQLRASLQQVAKASPQVFQQGLLRLVGMGLADLVQVICFHELHGKTPQQSLVLVHQMPEVIDRIQAVEWLPEKDVSSFSLGLKDWELHVRIKPMNKFTTTAIKINCAVKY